METETATGSHPPEHHLPDAIAVLSRTPAALDALLRDLPDMWTRRGEGEDTWSVFDVIGHLIEGERTDWMPRARIILQFGETRAFDPFDRFAHKREAEGKSRRGRHPALGGVTLSELVATWAVHDLTHLHQVSRIMAHQYRAAVGPWSAYLGVLHCDGHSS